jgi:hypothetical protein
MSDEAWVALFLTCTAYLAYNLTELVYAVMEVIFK